MQLRRRGAQHGNINALKHGLYSSRLTAGQRRELDEARALDPRDLREEIALVRARLAQLPTTADIAVVLLAARTIARLAATHHRLSPQATDDLADAVAAVIEHAGVILGPNDAGDFNSSLE